MLRRLVSAAALAAMFAAPSFAQEETGGPYTTLATNEAGGTEIVIQPANCSAGEDCPSFLMICPAGRLELYLRNLTIRHIERWAVGNEPVTLVIGNAVLAFSPSRMTEDPDWGWTARTRPIDEAAPLLGEMGVAGEVFLETPFYLFTLEPTEDDLANMAAFGESCLAAGAAG